ncbi:MAG TPA: hypothetical protein VLD13_10740, partial [Gaiellaceae bacterium]|nr:hypothetical protein [Gaiellaceae bacterium]
MKRDRTERLGSGTVVGSDRADRVDETRPLAELIRERDWAATPIGPMGEWPQSLRTALSICLESRFPILIWWGPEFVML